MINSYTSLVYLETVKAYMGHIQDNAEESVRSMLRDICDKFGNGKKVTRV